MFQDVQKRIIGLIRLPTTSVGSINPFYANLPFLYPLKLSKISGFLMLQGIQKENTGLKLVNTTYYS